MKSLPMRAIGITPPPNQWLSFKKRMPNFFSRGIQPTITPDSNEVRIELQVVQDEVHSSVVFLPDKATYKKADYWGLPKSYMGFSISSSMQ